MSITKAEFIRQLAAILNEPDGCGLYSREGLGPNGVRRVHHFSLAAGLGSLMWIGKYRRCLGANVPGWTEQANPYHVARMCRLAVENRRRLPKIRPELYSCEATHAQP